MAGAWRAGDAKPARRDDARVAGPRLPQHQLRDTGHVGPQILEALPPAIEDGLRLPFCAEFMVDRLGARAAPD